MREILRQDRNLQTIVRGTINARINNIIYMGLISGPKIANGKCGKTTDAGTMDRGSTVCVYIYIYIYTYIYIHMTASVV
jgi:hypothetical protein